MHTHDLGILSIWHNVGLFAILPTLQEGLYAGRPNWWECVDCYSIFSVSTPPSLTYHTYHAINDNSRATAVWHVATLEVFVLSLMILLIVVNRSAIGYDFLDPRLVHGSCSVINSVSSSIRSHADH